MLIDGSLTLSAVCLGIALAGAMSAIRDGQNKAARVFLTIVFGVFGGIVSAPLVLGFAPLLYGFYLPVVLVLLLVLPPAVFSYVCAKTNLLRSTDIRWRELVLPAAGGIVMVGYWVQPAATKTTMFIDGALPAGVAPAALALVTFALIFCWVVSSCIYLIAALKRLRAYRSHLRSLYSNLEAHDLRWLDWFVVSIVSLWGVASAMLVADNTGFERFLVEELILGLIACLMLFAMGFASIVPPSEVVQDPAPSTQPPEPKYARSALSVAHAEQLATRIRSAMEKDALYLDPNLSLQKLSRHVGGLPNQVSQTLNEQIGATFFDYVASCRINAAKPLIREGKASTLIVSLDVGFNSRSTFYKAFKRETGMTPKAYRASANM